MSLIDATCAKDASPSESPSLDLPTRLALERTRLAYDSTVMASVRTATSLITFGFAVYKFFEMEMKGRDHSNQFLGPREFGITMILIGLGSLSMSYFEYRRDLIGMRKVYPDMPHSTAGFVAALIATLGVVALIIAVVRR